MNKHIHTDRYSSYDYYIYIYFLLLSQEELAAANAKLDTIRDSETTLATVLHCL